MRNPAILNSNPIDELMYKVWYLGVSYPKIRNFFITCCILTFCWWFNNTNAYAADFSSGSPGTYFLPLDNVKDSSGVPVAAYSSLPIDQGGVTHPFRGARALIMNILWAFYSTFIFLILTFLEFILSLVWLEWLASPFILLAGSIHGILGQFGIIGVGLSLSALFIAVAFIRGRKATAILEILIVSAVGGLVSTPIGNPIYSIAMENGGIYKSAEYGNELGIETIDGAKDGDGAEPSAVNASIVDMTLRSPVMLMAFGKELEGECENIFNEKSKSGDSVEDIRKAVNSCDEEAKAGNETDSGNIFSYYFMNCLGIIGLMFLVIVFSFFMIKDVILSLIWALNTLIKGYFAVFPMGNRAAFFNAFFQTWINVIMVGVYIWLMSTYLWLIDEIITIFGAMPLMLGNTFMGIVIIVMSLVFFGVKRKGKKIGENIAKILGRFGFSKQVDSNRSPSAMNLKMKHFASDSAKSFFLKKAATKAALATSTGGVGLAAAAGATAAPILSSGVPRPQLTSFHTKNRGVPVGDPVAPMGDTDETLRSQGRSKPHNENHSTDENSPASETFFSHGRYSHRWAHKENVASDTNSYIGEIFEGPLPDTVKVARAWGGSHDITHGVVFPARSSAMRKIPSTFGVGSQ